MDINRNIDFTLLRQDAKLEDLFALCHDARENNFRAVCVHPWMVSKADELLDGTETSVCTVVGFPLGCNLTETKVEETLSLIKAGAEEIDMVANLSAFFSKNDSLVQHDIHAVFQVCQDKGVVLKVIIESGLLNLNQVRHICGICAEVGVDFVKTSTGFATVNAEIEKVMLMREILPKRIEIKASGGIKTYGDAIKFLGAGASRIGTSSLIKNGTA